MESLVYTPRRSDFIKDGSIFASKMPSTSQHPSTGPMLQTIRPQPQYATWLQHPQPGAQAAAPSMPAASPAVGVLCYPQTLQAAAASQAEHARQVRAKFENLVRASPIPQAMQQLKSPQNSRPQPVWQQLHMHALQAQQGSPQLWGTPDPAQSVSCKAILDPRLRQVTAHTSQAAHQLGPLRQSLPSIGLPQLEQPEIAMPKAERPEVLPAAVLLACTAASSDHVVEQPQAAGSLLQPADSHPDSAKHTGVQHAPVRIHQQQQQEYQPPEQQGQQGQKQQELLQNKHSQQAQRELPASGSLQRQHSVSAEAQLPSVPIRQASEVHETEQQELLSMSSLSPSLQLDIPGFHACLSSDASSYPHHSLQHHTQSLHPQEQHQHHASSNPAVAAQQQMGLSPASAGVDQCMAAADNCLIQVQEPVTMGLNADTAQHAALDEDNSSLLQHEPGRQIRPQLQQANDATVVTQSSADVLVNIAQDIIQETQPADRAAGEDVAMTEAGSGVAFSETEKTPKTVQSAPSVIAAEPASTHDNEQLVSEEQHCEMVTEDFDSSNCGHAQPTHEQPRQQRSESPQLDCNMAVTNSHQPGGDALAQACTAVQQEQQSMQGAAEKQASTDKAQEPAVAKPAHASTADSAVATHKGALAGHNGEQPPCEDPPQPSSGSNPAQHAQHSPSHTVESCPAGTAQHAGVEASEQEQHIARAANAESQQADGSADVEHCRPKVSGGMQHAAAARQEESSATLTEKVSQKRRQPASSTSTEPAVKRQCKSLRSSANGSMEPLLAAPTGVSWQDSKGTFQTSRTGRVRYPPLAFWMSETKVHDKQGGAVAIARPSALAPPKPAKPEPVTQSGPAKKAHSTRQQRPVPQPAEPSMSTGRPAQASADAPRHAVTQPSTYTVVPSPVRVAEAQAAAVSPSDTHQRPGPHQQGSKPVRALSKQQAGAGADVQQAEAVQDTEAGSLLSNVYLPGADLSAATAAAAACADPVAAAAALAAAVASAGQAGSARLRACGSCQHCLRPSLRKACLVLKALKAALAARNSGTLPEPDKAMQASKAGKAFKPGSAGKACQHSLAGKGCDLSITAAAGHFKCVSQHDTAGKAGQSHRTAAADTAQSDVVSQPTKAVTTGSIPRGKVARSTTALTDNAPAGKVKAVSRKRLRPEHTNTSQGNLAAVPSAAAAAGSSQQSHCSSESSDVSELVHHKRTARPITMTGVFRAVNMAKRQPYKRTPNSRIVTPAKKSKGSAKSKKAAAGKQAAGHAQPNSSGPVTAGSMQQTSQGPNCSSAAAGPRHAQQQTQAAAANKQSKHPDRSAASAQARSTALACADGAECEEQQAAEALQSLSQSPQGQSHASGASLQCPDAQAAPEQLPKATALSPRSGKAMQRSLADVLQQSKHGAGTGQGQDQFPAAPCNSQPQTGQPSQACPANGNISVKTEKVSPVNPQLKRLQKGRSANVAAVNPRGAVRAGQVASPASPSLASQAAQGWSEEQRAALQKAFLTVKPSQPKFWLHVANLVPGKTALQCCNAKFDEMPTPVEKPNPRGKLIPGQEGSPIQAPALKLAADHSILLSCPNVSTWSCTREPGGDAHGRVKKPTAAATKQFARHVRWQQRAQQQADEPDLPQPPSAAQAVGSHRRSNLGNSQSNTSSSTLLTALQKQQKADKYIDRILRKQGGRLHKVRPELAAKPAGRPGPGGQRTREFVSEGLMAQLGALNKRQPVEEDDYGSEQDHYFSDEDNDNV